MIKLSSAIAVVHLLLATSIASAASSTTLTSKQVEIWNTVVAPLYCKGQLSRLAGSRDDYSILLSLSQQANGLTTVPKHRQTAIELHVSLETWRKKLRSELDTPTTAALLQIVQSMPRSFSTSDSLDLLSIYIRRFENEPRSAARERALAAMREIEAGTSFSEVAMKYSDARSSALGGSAGTIWRGTISPEVEQVIFSLRSGETTGPIEREHGFHIYRVAKKRPAFSLEREEDRERALTIWQDRQVAQGLTEATDEWKRRDNVQVRKQPTNAEQWLAEPWITYGENQSVPFGLVFESVSRCDLNASQVEAWIPFWQEEAEALAPTIITALAGREIVRSSDEFRVALQMAEQVEPGWQTVQKFNSSLSPTTEDLDQQLSPHSADLYKPPTIYTFLFGLVPVPRGSSQQANAARLQATLNEVFDFVSEEKPASRAAAETLFRKMQSKFDGSTWTLVTDSEAPNPFVDPVLMRTLPGTLSRPFDNENGVGLVYVISKRRRDLRLQGNREMVESYWRRKQLQEFISKNWDPKQQ